MIMSALPRLKKVEKTPLSGRSTAATPSGLPLKFLGDASKRLGWASLIYAWAFTSAYFVAGLPEWIREDILIENLIRPNSISGYVSILMSIWVFIMSRSGRFNSQHILDVGLIYLVVSSFGISMAEFWGIYPVWSEELAKYRFMGIPWECAWILIFSVMAPNTKLKTFLASLCAASTGLVVVGLSRHFGATSPDVPWILFLKYFFFSTYLCAGMALVTSCIIHGFGKHLHRAEEFGSYQLMEQLGRGGMGEVWRARHRMLARPAAVKLIRAEVLGTDEFKRKEAVRRFEREAQATAMLESYHTIELFDFGTTDEGAFYYVMELLDGLNLDVFVKRFGPVSAGRAVFMLRQVCHSLAEAHEKQMIHRDIKPANIYVCRLGQDCDFIKVLDFGLVKSRRVAEEQITQLTLQGIAAGTPGFMAPEIAMSRGSIDGRSDIYSLGCVGYWLLTGQLVFAGETPLAEVVHHIQSAPVPPSQKTELDVPEDLEKIILSCLEKDPNSRPQSARELDQMLACCDIGIDWTNKKASEWWNLHLPRQEQLHAEHGLLSPASSQI